jgi:hypothetical protein
VRSDTPAEAADGSSIFTVGPLNAEQGEATSDRCLSPSGTQCARGESPSQKEFLPRRKSATALPSCGNPSDLVFPLRSYALSSDPRVALPLLPWIAWGAGRQKPKGARERRPRGVQYRAGQAGPQHRSARTEGCD